MTTRFGWCFGPDGGKSDHRACRYEIGAGGTILRCGCPCHDARLLCPNAEKMETVEVDE